MCFVDPISMTAIASTLGTVMSAAGTVAAAVGSIQQGRAAEATGEYNAQVAENNATAEKQRAAYDAGLISERKDKVRSAQEAGMAASGVDVGVGTPVAVLGDTEAQGERDVLARLYGGEVAATAAGNDANLFRAEGRAARKAGNIGAATSLMSGFGKMASGYQTPTPKYQPLNQARY